MRKKTQLEKIFYEKAILNHCLEKGATKTQIEKDIFPYAEQLRKEINYKFKDTLYLKKDKSNISNI